jgi:hypothetical protein
MRFSAAVSGGAHPDLDVIREETRRIARSFSLDYWREHDRTEEYPHA